MFTIATASLPQVQQSLEWARQEGWNPGLCDAYLLHSIDPQGFWIGHFKGEPIAALSKLNYGHQLSFFGLLYVCPEFRGRGYGRRLWQHAQNYVAEVNCGCDARLSEVDFYQQAGFKLAFISLRHQVIIGNNDAFNHPNLQLLGSDCLAQLIEYDSNLFPAPRQEWLRAWSQAYPTLLYLEEEQIVGYGVIRQCYSGYKIGPLFADSPAIASTLLRGLMALANPGASLYIDIPAANSAAVQLANELGMKVISETARMFKQPIDKSQLPQTFGLTALGFG